MVEHTRRRVGHRARVVVADLSQPLDLVDGASMDLVAASLVLHYLRVSAVFTPLISGGLVITDVHEPSPELEERAVPDDRMRAALNTTPVFLYVRATRPH